MLSDQGDDDDNKSRKTSESLSISGLILCCYLRRWDNEEGINDDGSTTATHAGTSELYEDNVSQNVSELRLRVDSTSNPGQTSVMVEHKFTDQLLSRSSNEHFSSNVSSQKPHFPQQSVTEMAMNDSTCVENTAAKPKVE